MHRPGPDPELVAIAQAEPEHFLESCVKVAFTDGERVEHMWVEIESVDPMGRLVGKLRNDPVRFPPDVLRHGSEVVVPPDEIEEVDWKS